MGLLKKKGWDYLYRFYIIGFLVFLSLIVIVPIRSWMPGSVYNTFYILFLGLGCILILQDLLTQRSILGVSLWWTVVVCSGIMVFNTFFNRVGGSLGEDIKTTLWVIELVTLCYSSRIRLGKEIFSKTMHLGLNLALLIHSLAAIVSIVQARLGYTAVITARGVSFHQGFYGGRLWGTYMTVGLANSVICIVLAVFFLVLCKKWYQKIFYTFCIVINYISFLLENARACEVAFLIAVACTAWILSRKYLYKRSGKIFVKEGIAVIMAIACVAGAYIMNYGCRTLAYYVINGSDEDSKAKDNVVVRRNIVQRDIRIDIWTEYIYAYGIEMRPLGYNKSGYKQYLIDHYPETLKNVSAYNFGTHSVYVDALCRVGWVGMIFLTVWIIYHIWRSLQYIIKQIDLSSEEIGCLAIIVIMMVDGIFGETALWTFAFPEVMIFWLLTGDLTFILQKRNKKGHRDAR